MIPEDIKYLQENKEKIRSYILLVTTDEDTGVFTRIDGMNNLINLLRGLLVGLKKDFNDEEIKDLIGYVLLRMGDEDGK